MLLSQRRVITQLPRCRSCRRLVRNTGWWENVWNNYSEVRFKKTFRISRATFQYILDRIEPILAKQTLTEDPISPDERLAICLYRLGRGDYYYTIAEMVGRGVSTVSSIVEEVSQVLVNHLWNDCFNTLSWFNRSFQRKNSRHARALTIPLLLGSNWQLPYPNKVPSRRIRILQRVPQLQQFLLYCLDGHSWFKSTDSYGEVVAFREIPMMPLFWSPRTYGTHFKMDCCQILLKLLVKSVYPHL